MGRIINALRYGDSETRKCIGSVILFSVIAVILIVVASLTGKFALFIIGLVSAVIAIILSQTFTLMDDDFVAEVGKDGAKDTVASVSVKRNGIISSSSGNSKSKKESKDSETGKKSSDKTDDDGKEKEDKNGDKESTEKEYADADRFDNYYDSSVI